MNDSASAILNTETIAFQTNVNDSSNLILSGGSENHSLIISGTGKVDVTNFDATNHSLKLEDQGQLVINHNGKNVVIQRPAKV